MDCPNREVAGLMKIISGRMVMREPISEESVQLFANEFNMTKIRELSVPERQTIVREVTWEVNPGLKMHYALDRLSSSSFIVVEGDDDRRSSQLVDAVEDGLDPWTLDELLEEVDLETALYDDDSGDSRSVAQAVIRLGVGTPNEYNEEVFGRISGAMRSSEAWVRRAAIWATAYSRWPQFLPLLNEIADTDPDQEIRSDARAMVDIDEPGNES
jgi:hypothetical protein